MALPSDRRRNQPPSPFSTGGFLDDLFQDLEDARQLHSMTKFTFPRS